MLKKRIKYTDIFFGKSGMVPTHYRGRLLSEFTENQQKEVQTQWEQLIDEELADCPEFAKKPLQNARKHQVKFTVSYGCKCD